MSKKIRVRYTAHTSAHDIEKFSVDFTVSDITAEEILMMVTPVERDTCHELNLKTAIYWIARLRDCFFDLNDQILSVKEVKK